MCLAKHLLIILQLLVVSTISFHNVIIMQDTLAPARFHIVDCLRGSAIFMMIVFHFCFDLTLFGHAEFDFYNSPFWIHFRTLIVSIFCLVMGMSMTLAYRKGFNWVKFNKRLVILIGCALLITISTYFTSGERFIYFGILHFIAVASLLAIPFLRLYWSNLVIGVGILLLDYFYQNPLFHKIYLQWIGLMQYKPATDDYAPLIPWFGVVLIGMFIARWTVVNARFPELTTWQPENWLTRALQIAGIHSLLIYMLHQPLFYGLFYLYQSISG